MNTEPHHSHDDEPNDDQPDEGTAERSAMTQLRAARYWVAAYSPYYTTALYRCALRTTGRVATVAIDQHWRIWANPAHVNTLTVTQAAVELMHVLNHALRSHRQRAPHRGDPLLGPAWNLAADCEINDDLTRGLHQQRAEIPEHWPTPRKLDWTVNQTAEAYYQELLDSAYIDIGTGYIAWMAYGYGDVHRAHGDCGSAATGIAPDWEPPPDERTPTRFEEQLLRQRTARAALGHNDRHPGSVPGSLITWARDYLRPKADWRQELAATLRRTAHRRSGDSDYTWTRPPRRPNPHTEHGETLRPATTRPTPNLAIVMDTSASMEHEEHAQAVAEIDAICRHVVPGHHIDYYAVDTQANAHQRITDARKLKLDGGGGTDMAQGITHANQTRPDAIIVLTDGETPWPKQPPPGNPTVIAALIGEDTATEDVPHWMRLIRID